MLELKILSTKESVASIWATTSGIIDSVVAKQLTMATFFPRYRNVKKSTEVANLTMLLRRRMGNSTRGAITKTREKPNKAKIMV